ncbi:MAG: alpha/beta fold hydrolase [Runella slithyformis]|nr:MAG: alpha/beta fold hydrolase [Runella slithyformis]
MQLFFRQVGTGQPLIILHGLFGSCDNWLTISKTIADQGFAVYLLDQRNHGRSPQNDDFNYGLMAADLQGFIAEHQLTKPILVGHSMGGKTVMQYAMNYPNTFHKLVVVDMAPKFYPVHHTAILEGLAAVPLATLASRQAVDAILAQYEPNVGVRQFLLKNLYRTDAGAFGWRINLPAITTHIELIGHALQNQRIVSEPTLFMRGQNSDYVLDTDIPDILKLFPKATIDTIAGAGHWVQAEQPEGFVTSLMRFLQ